jgi:prevent-host-death family protein
MPDTITADDAGQQFSRLLREVEAGAEFVITRNGVPVARIVPEAVPATLPDGKRKLTEAQEAALARTLERARNGSWGPIEHISREQLYDEVIDERIWRRRPR